MSKPEDIPQDVWDEAMRVAVEMEIHAAVGSRTDAKAAVIAIAMVGVVARAILAAKVEEREACAVVAETRHPLRIPEGRKRPYVSTQIGHSAGLGIAAAIRKRGEVNTAHKNSEVQ